MNRNQSIDTMRYLAALAIITLHVGFPGLPPAYGETVRLLSRWAVPFFFMMSGYFLAAPGCTRIERGGRTAARMLWLLVVWSLLYSLINVFAYGSDYAFQQLLRVEVFSYGTYSHLWFLGSLALGALSVAALDMFRMEWFEIPLAVALVVFALVTDSYNLWGLRLDPEFSRQLLSIPFLLAGGWLRRWTFSAPWPLVLIVGGALMQFGEASWLLQHSGYPLYEHQFLAGTVFMAVGLAAFCIRRPRMLERPGLARLGAQYSLGVYLLHRGLVFAFVRVQEAAGWTWVYAGWWSVLFPLIVLVVATGVLAVMQRGTKDVFGWTTGRLQRAREGV